MLDLEGNRSLAKSSIRLFRIGIQQIKKYLRKSY